MTIRTRSSGTMVVTDHATTINVTVFAQCHFSTVDGERNVQWKATFGGVDVTNSVDDTAAIAQTALDCTTDEASWEGEIEDVSINVLLSGSVVPGYEGKTYGAPEDCYPGEGDDVDDVCVKLPSKVDITDAFAHGHFDDVLVELTAEWGQGEAEYAAEMAAESRADRERDDYED